MTLSAWALLSLTLLAGAATPGASLALVISTTTRHGRLSGLVQSLAHGVGVGFYALLVSTGISTVLLASEHALFILQFFGGLLLLYLGGKMVLAGWQSRNQELGGQKTPSAEAEVGQNLWSHASKGFLIVFLNPKIALFFFAVFSQFLNQDQSLLLQWSMASLAATIDTLWYIFVSILVSLPIVAKRLLEIDWQLEMLWGLVLLFIAVGLVTNI